MTVYCIYFGIVLYLYFFYFVGGFLKQGLPM